MMGGVRTTVAGKALVPPPAAAVLPRPAIEERLDEAAHRRLTVVTAASGLGKTTLLSAWGRRRGCAWYTLGPEDRDPSVLARHLLEAARMRVPALDPGAVEPSSTGPGWEIPSEGQGALAADQVVGMLTDRLDGDLVLVLDDVHALAGTGASTALLADLVRESPSGLHLVLSSRLDPPFPVGRLRAQGLALDLPGAALRFSEAETAALAAVILGPEGATVGAALHRATAGWPAGLRLVAEWLRSSPPARWPDLVGAAGDAGGPLEAFLLEEVLPATAPEVLALLRAVVSLERFTPALAAELAGPEAEEVMGRLVRDGLWVVPDADRDGWFVVPPVLCRFLTSRLRLGADEEAQALRRAAAWLEGHGQVERPFARLLTGAAPAAPGADDDDATPRYAEAGAHLVRGDYDAALAAVAPSVPADGPMPMSAALIVGLVHHFRGQLAEASAVYDRGLAGPGDDTLRAMLLGWAAGAAWVRGDVDRCRALTAAAEAAAADSGDDRAWAIAHTARAMVAALDGDPAAMRHYERALAHAEAAHDHVQIVRIRTNRGSRLLSEGHYGDALVELDEAVRLADLAGIAVSRALALSNRGEALMGLGRLDEAARELEAAKAHYERLGSRMASYPLAHLGTVYRLQGHLSLAVAHYEEAIAAAEASGLHQGLVPALAGLALTLAGTDPDAAAELARRAAAVTSLDRPEALLAAAEVALQAGDAPSAAARAREASAAAWARRDRPALALALEVEARAALGAPEAPALLDEAAAVWAAIGNPLGEARVLLAQARRGGPDADADAAKAELAARRLGARALAAEAARVRADLARAARPALSVRVLGGFAVERGGEPVPGAEWQSRKARDLLKILVARRGRPVPRDVLIDLLWPDEDPAKAGSRLSVTLSTVRAVLDPDKRFAPEHFVANDRAAAWLCVDHVKVDIEAFLADATAGLDALATGRAEAAGPLLTRAEAAYAGDFLEEDPYEDWPVVLREEARATYVSVAMALADLALAGGDHDGAARYLLRVLARDPYDERAHLKLVAALSAAGGHGEARRMYRAYGARMAEIGVEPAPFPDAPRRAAPAPA